MNTQTTSPSVSSGPSIRVLLALTVICLFVWFLYSLFAGMFFPYRASAEVSCTVTEAGTTITRKDSGQVEERRYIRAPVCDYAAAEVPPRLYRNTRNQTAGEVVDKSITAIEELASKEPVTDGSAVQCTVAWTEGRAPLAMFSLPPILLGFESCTAGPKRPRN